MNRHMSSTDVVPPRSGLGVRHVRRGAGDLGRQGAVRGVDVVLEPLPQRHRLRRAPQQPRVQVSVVEPGDHGVHRRVDRRHGGGGRVLGHLVRPTDRGDDAVDDEHRARVVNGPSRRPSARRSRRGSAHCSSPRPCPTAWPSVAVPPAKPPSTPSPWSPSSASHTEGGDQGAERVHAYRHPSPWSPSSASTRKAVTKALNGCTRIAIPRLGHVRRRHGRR